MTATITTRRGARWGLSLAVAAMLASTACGDDGGGPFGMGEGGEVSRELFQERAGAACTEFFNNVVVEFLAVADPATGEPPLDAQEELGVSAASHGEQLLTQLRSIGAPQGQTDEWTEWTDLLEESIDDLREDPAAAFGEETDPERSARIDELSQALGAPECTGEDVEFSDEAIAPGAQVMAAAIQAESGGLITDDEADCIANGAIAVLPSDLAQWGDLDFEQLPPEQQGAFLEIFTDCLPAEKLVQIGEM